MLLIIASKHNQSAARLAERWRHIDARLMTVRDLSRDGWRYYPGDPRNSCATIGDETIPLEAITGALTCIPAVTESDLTHIVPTDRSYVAAEMTAFLAAWLSYAPFPVINRPTPNCLMGPCWSRTRWLHEAAQSGMNINGASDRSDRSQERETVRVTVVGDNCHGRVANQLSLQARRLARAARVQTMTVEFSESDDGAYFVRAYPGIDLRQADIADSLLECFAANALACA